MTRKSTILILMIIVSTLEAWSLDMEPPQTYVVCVGIADYPGKQNDLRVSAKDAKTIAKIYSSSGAAETHTLVNDAAKLANVLTTVRKTFAKAGPYDTVIFYFSGHGSPGKFLCYDGGLQYQQLFSILKECKAQNKIIIADACYAGKMRTGKKRMQQKYNPDNIVLFLSSRTNEKSRETGFSNSLFTMYLERGLRGGADANKDKVVTAREIYKFVHDGVTQIVNGKQHPVMWGRFNPDTPLICW